MATAFQGGSTRPLLPLMTLSCAAGAFELVHGFIYPAIALNLEERGASADLIGYQAAMVGLGLALSPLVVPWLIARWGAAQIGVANIALASLTLLGFGLLDAVGAWFLLGLMFGMSANVWYVQSEVWLNELSGEASRGRSVGLFVAIREGAFAFGPLLIPLLGYVGLWPYATMALVIAWAGILPMSLCRRAERPPPTSIGEMISVGRTIPVLLFAVAVSGYADGAVLPLWVIYALEQGVAKEQAVWTLSVIIFGSVVLQWPLGWIADKAPRGKVLGGCALAACIGSVLLPALDLTSWLAWPYLLVWGALGVGVYTLSLVVIGQYLSGTRLVVATAALGVTWGLGALLGSAITGQAMAWFGALGLPASVGLAYGALWALALFVPPTVGAAAVTGPGGPRSAGRIAAPGPMGTGSRCPG